MSFQIPLTQSFTNRSINLNAASSCVFQPIKNCCCLAANILDPRKGIRYLTESLDMLYENFPVLHDKLSWLFLEKAVPANSPSFHLRRTLCAMWPISKRWCSSTMPLMRMCCHRYRITYRIPLWNRCRAQRRWLVSELAAYPKWLSTKSRIPERSA